MCGLVGKYYFDTRRYISDDLETMMNSIRHRGPDDSGRFQDDRVAIGFQRLSIIDTLTGSQPLYNESREILVIANGEIYNFKELRAMLESRGHAFGTRSDCEVLVHLYEEYGREFVSMLNGMFAFCIYDMKSKTALLARDRMGIKPLYYHHREHVFVFGSEIKGVLASHEVPVTKETDVLDEYLCFRCLANNRTFFAGIKSVEPGTCVELSESGVTSWKFCTEEAPDVNFDAKDVVDRLTSTLHSSVARQMVSDVPLGTLLSGGVDSSWVSATAGSISPGLQTFTVAFHDRRFDESPYAKMLARHFKLDYREIRTDNKDFADKLVDTIWFHDEPLNHANSVQIYLISRFAREYVKVLLTGEGADELHGGYPRYFICKEGAKFFRLNRWAQNAVVLMLSMLPFRKLQKLRRSLGLTEKDLILWNAQFSTAAKVAWLLDKKEIDIHHRTDMLEKLMRPELDLMDNLLLFEQHAYLQSILMRQDKLSMAASIESRVPMLDNEMLALAASIPSKFKLMKYQPKFLLKKAAAQVVPKEIVYKKKVGFGVPVGDWLRDEKGIGRYLTLLLDVSGTIDGIRREKVEKIVKEHRGGLHNHEDILWPLINYAIWQDKFFG